MKASFKKTATTLIAKAVGTNDIGEIVSETITEGKTTFGIEFPVCG